MVQMALGALCPSYWKVFEIPWLAGADPGMHAGACRRHLIPVVRAVLSVRPLNPEYPA